MDKMPYKIKEKIRQYNKAIQKAAQLSAELNAMFDEYGVPLDNLTACADCYSGEPQTEALAYINNAECTSDASLEEEINRIEEVFLFFVNQPKEAPDSNVEKDKRIVTAKDLDDVITEIEEIFSSFSNKGG